MSRYKVLPDLAGAAFLPLGLLARLPLAMLTVGTLTLVAVESASYALAGVAAGAVGIGSAIGAPILGALADRAGQKKVLLIAAALNTVAVTAVVLAALSLSAANSGDQAGGAVVVAALLSGLTTPQVGPFARARWMGLTEGRTLRALELDAALSYEGTADELTFVLGPALVGLLGAGIAPWLPLSTAAFLTATFVTAFALHPTASAVRPIPRHELPAVTLREWSIVLVPVAAMVAMGTFFGGTQAALTAFAGEHGSPDLAGLLYAALGLTSAVAALSVAVWPPAFGLRLRWAVCAGCMLVFSLSLFAPHGLTWMTGALLLVGIPVGPIMVTVFGIGGRIAPRGRTGTVMTALASGIVAGTALGAAIGGQLAARGGTAAALWAPVAAAGALLALGAGAAVVRRR
ncbi:MFS transporter [Sinomonas humi]|uniref:MFS transporter n=1 Tax=Sinomonas humi TaxID=1338436 RepID=UPI001E46C859|nr:MFS transporter [Sinomonas humi]